MKKCIAVLLAMALSLAACGGSAEDPNAGVYHGVAAEVSGKALAMTDIYAGQTRLELNSGGKGNLKLDGVDFPVKWKLEGETITGWRRFSGEMEAGRGNHHPVHPW